jgi:RimJ/RimL family protein N-acetyltransferase
MSDASTPASLHALLDDGLEVLIRPISRDDKRLLADAFERLSPTSRYRRFFSPRQSLSEQDLRYLTEVDHHDHEAIAAVNPENGAIVGVARYVRSDEPSEAEVAIVVGDPWQGHGVATALLKHLVVRAREEGIEHFIALILSENVPAIESFRHLAPRSKTRRSASGHTELLLDLPDPERIGDSTLGGALRAAAAGLLINPWRVLRERIARRGNAEG